MEQARGSIMTGIRAFSAHLPLTSILYYYYYSISIVALYCFIYFQVNTGVSYFLDYVEDIYIMVVLSVFISILNPNPIYCIYHCRH